MSMKENLEKLAHNMKRWQKIEKKAVAQTARIMEETDHPLIHAVMEIIHNDSQNHYRVQQLIIDSIEKEYINVFTDDLAKVWDSIKKHIAIEKQTIELAQMSLDALESSKNVVQRYPLEYLQADEEKHDKLLADLDRIKRSMYP